MPPDAGFSTGNAMGRNKLIYSLARRVLVVCSDRETGGTWAGATEALRARWCEVVGWRGPGEGTGNEFLASQGAVEVSDLAGLLSVAPAATSDAYADQLSLDV